MKRCIPMALTILATLGCGQFTNVPAQVKLKSVDAPALITYSFDATTRTTVATVTNPKVTFESELGSIGVTYDTMTVTFFTANGRNSIPGTGTKADGSTDLRFTVRIPSSHLNKDANGNITTPGTSGSVELPLLSPVVQQWGQTHFLEGNLSMAIELSGDDDATWPRSLTFTLPISLAGNVNRV